MDDLISRQAAIDALGEEPEVWTENDEYAQGLNKQWHYDVIALKALPSAQPEIIRCKDCKHRVLNDNYIDGMAAYMKAWCNLDTGDPYELGRKAYDDEWYCADAERREEGDDDD